MIVHRAVCVSRPAQCTVQLHSALCNYVVFAMIVHRAVCASVPLRVVVALSVIVTRHCTVAAGVNEHY